ncbi:hypothetical protein MKZ38_008671 [Zalerion maritima]|uniref:Uncharacterized protein n=1 Tax=Zalerion maritima TaxID=339359 RepID=A0AAD5WNI5_9PEZI|nr:hypothetical protein MKZ38_008671 [Zalerion maritima]
MSWNVFRWAGDISHCLSKLIITYAIHRNRSAEGVSWITQVLYALVFLSRYTDIFQEHIAWNRVLKWFYILSSIYIVFIMRFWFPRTREREIAWKLGGIILVGSLLLSPLTLLVLPHHIQKGFGTWLWDFSEILESVCVLPQLLLLRQTTVPTVIDSFYLVTLGSYRALYVLNWVVRYADSEDRGPEVVSVIFGIIQTALYIDFGWVYWTRQRVKLRNGGIVDADDLQRGWLVNRVLGRHPEPTGDDEESAPALGGNRGDRTTNNKWGARGISVSADDGVLQGEHEDQEEGLMAGPVDPDARMQDPDELARALNETSSEDDSDDDDDSDSDDSGDSDDSKAKKKTTAGVDAGTSAWRS